MNELKTILRNSRVKSLISAVVGGIQFQDEGVNLGDSSANTVDFTGAGVTASRSGDKVTVAISAGGSSTASINVEGGTERKVSAMTALTGATVASGDLFTAVDVSDTTDAATGTNKKITADEVRNAIPDLFSFMRPGTDHWPNALFNATESNFVLTANQLRACAFLVTKTYTITAIAFNVTSNVASSKARCGIYTANATTYLPDQLVAGSDAVEYDTGSNGVKTSGAVSITLTPGLYWFAILTNGGITVRSHSAGTGTFTNVLGTSNASSTGARIASSWTVNLVYTTMPATFTGGGTINDNSTIKFAFTL